MKEEIRLFIAVTLPTEMKQFLQKQVQPFEHPSVRMIPEQNLHLTLFFIGNTPMPRLEPVKAVLELISATHTAFELQYLCTEPGPNPKSPRLVWARFEQHPAFEDLSKALSSALSPDQSVKQKPIPHVTLARYKKDTSRPPRITGTELEANMTLKVDSISLWQSVLASPHPVYSVLETYPLLSKP